MADLTTGRDRLWPVLIVSATVLLQLAAAYILDLAAAASHGARLGVVALVAVLVAIGFHGFRFVLWGFAHRRYPLSHTYPLTALFFPFILLISHLRGDHVDGWQVAGTVLITLGVGLMAMEGSRETVSR